MTPLTRSTYVTDTGLAREVVASFDDYLRAQAAVDLLADKEFDVSSVQIVGNGVRTVENVHGRMTKGRAALSGAGSGAWFGLLIGLLFGIFAPAFGWVSMILTAVVLGALWGALFGFIAHWATRGQRDFVSAHALSAQRYDIVVDEPLAGRAAMILGEGR